MQPRVSAGWRTIFKINNQVVAAGFVLDYTIDTGVTVIQGLDNVFPDELAPERIEVTMNVRVYRTPENDPVAGQIAPGGDISAQRGGDPQQDFVSSPYISVEVRDRLTDRTILFLPKAFLVRRSGAVEAESLMTETWTIRSIGFLGPGSQESGVVPTVTSLF